MFKPFVEPRSSEYQNYLRAGLFGEQIPAGRILRLLDEVKTIWSFYVGKSIP